jgi:hypothetical protein
LSKGNPNKYFFQVDERGKIMAIESKRGCGYRKVNGIYLVMGPAGFACDRLPLELSVCPCCGEGVKFSRGFTWIQPLKLFGGDHVPPCSCLDTGFLPLHLTQGRVCPVCQPSYHFAPDGRAGLMWIGEKFYSTESFTQEAAELGISKRISAIPHGFKIGETWIFLAHKKAIKNNEIFDGKEIEKPKAGIFMAFKPARIEKIVLQSEYDLWIHVNKNHDPLKWLEDKTGDLEAKEIYQRFLNDHKRGFSFVPVPDDDADHNPAAVHSNVKDPEYLPPKNCDGCGGDISSESIIFGHPDPDQDGRYCGDCNIKHLKVEAEKLGV